MRLFIAIDLDSPARAAVVDLQRRLRRSLAPASLKWVRPEQLHVTLVFIGEIDDLRMPAIAEATGADIQLPPFRLGFGNPGVFPPAGAPHVLWVGVAEGAHAVVDLQRRMAQRIEGVGVASSERVFQPHLTLARWPNGRPSDRQRVAAGGAAAIPSVLVEAVTLYQSRLSSSGAVHLALATAQLRSA